MRNNSISSIRTNPPSSSSGKFSTPSSSSTISADEIARVAQDLTLLQIKLNELNGESAPQSSPASSSSSSSSSSNVSSPFVSGLRGLATGDGKMSILESPAESKLNALERVLHKMSELDRVILKKTAPQGVDTQSASQRRMSRGSDLYSLPTHLHLCDRLLDLHTLSKRITVLHKTTPSLIVGQQQQSAEDPSTSIVPLPPSTAKGGASLTDSTPTSVPISPRANKVTSELQNSISKLTKQLEDSEERRVRSQEECASSRKELITIKRELEELQEEKRKNEMLNATELESLKSQLHDSLQLNIQLQSKYDKEVDSSKGIIYAINEKTRAFHNIAIAAAVEISTTPMSSSSSYEEGGSDISNNAFSSTSWKTGQPSSPSKPVLNNEAIVVLKQLDESILKYTEAFTNKVSALHSIKDYLECELTSYSLEREMLNKDLLTLSSEHEALKVAYHSLETESININHNNNKAKIANDNNEKDRHASNELLEQLQSELAQMVRKTMELEKLQPLIIEYESQNSLLNRVINENSKVINELNEEINNCNKINEKLKQKLRDFSQKSNGNASSQQDFLDSFEEVMKDEMMAMKVAFENKLKIAKEEANEMSRKHYEKIQSLQASNSSSLLGFPKK